MRQWCLLGFNPASQPASQPANQPTNQPTKLPTHTRDTTSCQVMVGVTARHIGNGRHATYDTRRQPLPGTNTPSLMPDWTVNFTDCFFCDSSFLMIRSRQAATLCVARRVHAWGRHNTSLLRHLQRQSMIQHEHSTQQATTSTLQSTNSSLNATSSSPLGVRYRTMY